ncbi:MAG: septation protein SepH [Ilumatobacteraceae bacterium]
MDSALRPRDIQARIRAGASAEEVADVAGVPVDRIAAYAVPVLAERAHTARLARAATVRRKHTAGPTRLLGDVVDAQLRERGSEPDEAVWDSWRRDDGRWVVTVRPDGSPDTGRYVYDAPGRYVVADDDLARTLIADEPSVADPTEMAIASAVAEASLADEERDADVDTDADTDGSADGTDVVEPAPPTPIGRPEPRRRRPRGRASVPSWDEIMFGGGKQER